jgi:hypothetical protein
MSISPNPSELAPYQDPSLVVGSTYPVQLEVQRLRDLMMTAPDFKTDFNERDESLTRYAYGSFLPLGDEPGLVIAEEIIPTQELLDSNNQRVYMDGGWSRPMGDYMSANTFVGLANRGLSQAFEAFGYRALSVPSGHAESQIIVAAFPGVESYNRRLEELGISAYSLVDNYDGRLDRNDPNVVMDAFADGKIIVNSALDMLMNVSTFGLLDDSVIKELQKRAQIIKSGTDGSEPALKSNSRYEAPDAQKFAMGVGAKLGTLIMGDKLRKALSDPYDGNVTPTTEQELGYDLALNLEMLGDRPANDGYDLAQKTVAHIKYLMRQAGNTAS